MFSPEASFHASSIPTRNPRRRQRTHSEEPGSASQRSKKRQRSALAQESFIPPPDLDIDGNENEEETVFNGDSIYSEVDSGFQGLALKDKSKSSKRKGKGDGSIVLSKNDTYVVSQLPSLPDSIRSNKKERFHGGISSLAGFALAFTHTHALVWSYNSTQPIPNKSFSFKLQEQPVHSSDPLPIGCLTPRTTSSAEPGLLVVLPSTGRITYWASLSDAATVDVMRQRHLGVAGSVGSMLSGEFAVNIVDAEPSGFLLTFSSGRFAHLRVRDPQGRPGIFVQFLRHSGGSGGFLGGLKNVFGGGAWRKNIAGVKAGKSHVRGQRDIIVGASNGSFQIWDTNWSGRDTLRQDFDAKPEIAAGIAGTGAITQVEGETSLEVLDFHLLSSEDTSMDSNTQDADIELRLLALVAFVSGGSWSYALVELTLEEEAPVVRGVQHIRYYKAPAKQRGYQTNARLHLPAPGHVAFIVFDDAVVIASVRKLEESPSTQLLADTQGIQDPFEDVIEFRKGTEFQVVGTGVEDAQDKSKATSDPGRPLLKHPGCLLLVRGFGVVRVSVFENNDQTAAIDSSRLTVKSKIEQAVFYGTVSNNLLNFSARREIQFTAEEVEQAALQISNEILTSTSEFIPLLTPSLDHQLKVRASALKHLAIHLKENYPPISRVGRWQMMWDAEKLMAARAVWRSYDAVLRGEWAKEKHLIPELVIMLSEKFKTEPVPELGELDAVRQWFIRDVSRMEFFVPWACQTVLELYKEGVQDPRVVTRLASEANDISLGALETAFRFRSENMSLYGLEHENLENGILRNGYENLPEFWTSTQPVSKSTKDLTDLSRQMATDHWKKPSQPGDPDPRIIKKLADDNPRQVQISCQTYQEYYRWLFSRGDEYHVNGAEHVREAHLRVRRVQMTSLLDIDKVHEALALAEKYRDMIALVEIVAKEVNHLGIETQRPELSAERRAEAQERLEALQDRIESYFRDFGDEWAHALYSRHIEQGRLFGLLDDNADYQPYLTRFLRSNPQYAKLSWINDVCGENSYLHAANTLLALGQHQETNVWSKKVELSLGKLAVAAVREQRRQPTTRRSEGELVTVHSELAMIDIQEKLFRHLASSIKDSLDEKAAVQLAMEKYGQEVTKDNPAMHQMLEMGLEALIERESMSPDQLIDTLTLIDSKFDSDNQDDLNGSQFYLALRVLDLCGLEYGRTRRDLTEKIIWRRCFVRDNWNELNDTSLKGDQAVEDATHATALFKTLKEGFRNDLWNASSSMRILSPQQVKGAGCSPNELSHRFGTNSEDLREPVAKGMQIEDELLEKYVSKGRLDHWFEGIKDAAKKSLEDDRDTAAESTQLWDEISSKIEAGIPPEEDEQMDMDEDAEMDDEGDVSMG